MQSGARVAARTKPKLRKAAEDHMKTIEASPEAYFQKSYIIIDPARLKLQAA
jgi:hypothetical protein